MAFSVLGFDVIFIFLSYVFIFQAVFKLPQKEARFKAFNICTAHIFVFLQSYILTFFTSFIHRFGFNVAPMFTFCSQTSLVPALLNPIVYRLKTKKIRELSKCLLPETKLADSPDSYTLYNVFSKLVIQYITL